MKASSTPSSSPTSAGPSMQFDGKAQRYNASSRSRFTSMLLREHTYVAFLTLTSMYYRVMGTISPSGILNQELELCSQVNWYLQGKFFVGAFPPLAGMMYTYLAHHLGYKGDQTVYYSGQILDAFPIEDLRVFSAMLGSLLVPATYLIVRALGHGSLAASMAAGLVIFENGLVTQSRYISTEGPLCLFTGLTILAWVVQMKKQEREPFAIPWTSLLATGVGIGTCISTKWQGVFTFIITWISSFMYLWRILGEKRFSLWYVGRQFTARFLATAALPMMIYYAIFHVHMGLIPKAGDHDLAVSSPLRYSLEGNHHEPVQKDIAYGSSIVLRHLGSNGGYLHSHLRRYKEGSTQQEVTMYPHFDLNNIWIIHRAGKRWNDTQPLEYVRNNDQVMLEHYATSRKLHSHDHRPPVTNKKEQSEVTAYGDPYITDPHDYWWAQIIFDDDIHRGKDKTPIQAINTRFRLLHVRGCHLMSHKVSLPENEDGMPPQQEVSCFAPAKKEVSTFVIESAYHEQLEDKESISYPKMTTMEKIMEVHSLMLSYPSTIQDQLASKKPADPLYQHFQHQLQKPRLGIWFTGKLGARLWDQVSGKAVYITLNPLGRMLTLFSILGCAIFWVVDTLLKKRQVNWLQVKLWANTGAAWAGYDPIATRELFHQSIGFLSMATVLQVFTLRFMPTFSMHPGDILPNTLLSAGFVSIVIEAVTMRWARRYRVLLFMLLVGLAAHQFYRLSPVTYGDRALTVQQCQRLPRSAGIDCQRFLKSNKGETASLQIDMPGKTETFKYTVGSEKDADASIASMRRASYSEALHGATGAERYHAIVSTPGPSHQDVKEWQISIQHAAEERIRIQAEKAKQEEEEKKKEEEEMEDDDEEEQPAEEED